MTTGEDVAPLKFRSLEDLITFSLETMSDQKIPNAEAVYNLWYEAKKYEKDGHHEWAYKTYKQCMDACSTVLNGESGPMRIILQEVYEAAKMRCEQLWTLLEVRYNIRDKLEGFGNSADGLSSMYKYIKEIKQEYKDAMEQKIQIGKKLMNSSYARDKTDTNLAFLLFTEFKNILPQCSICFEVPSTKIFQCQEGHILCETCSVNICVEEKCPVCRRPYGNQGKGRNRELEKLLHNLWSSTRDLPEIQSVKEVGENKSVIMRKGLDDWKATVNKAETARLKITVLKHMKKEGILDDWKMLIDSMLQSKKFEIIENEEIKVNNLVINCIKA